LAQHIIVSTTSPTSAPTALGQHYINTSTGTIYMSSGTTSTADWKPSTQLSNEELQDILGPMFEGTSPISATYDDLNNKVVISLNQTLLDHTQLQNKGTNTHAQIDSHISSTFNPHGVTKSQVGLSNVDNTSDLNKPISTATQTALNAKENTITSGVTTQYWRGDKSWQTLDKNAVGLGNVDNTSDLNKPISNLTQTALNSKENSFSSGTTTQYFRGDKTWQTLDKTAVGLPNVDNTSDLSKPISTATQTALNAKENSFTSGTITQYLRGDKSWQTLDKNAVGLGNVDNTSDLNKPISNLTQTALNGKEPSITSGVTTQYWRGDKSWQTLDKNAVGLGNVDNTSDLNKPISNATQTALNSKANTTHTHVSTDITDFTPASVVAAKTNLTNTPPSIQNLTDASSAGISTEFARADHKHAFDVTGVIPGPYGDSITVPNFTVNSQGQITSAGETAIPDATTTSSGFMSATDKTKLDGITLDTVQRVTTALNTASNTVLTAVNELAINVVAGKRYKFKFDMLFRTAATNTGITFSIGGTATGSIYAMVEMPISNNVGTTNKFCGPLLALNGVVTSTGVGTANQLYVGEIEGIFVASTSGIIYPQFRSEVSASQATVDVNSIVVFKEF